MPPALLPEVIAALERDEVVVVPTDTVYGLATRVSGPAIQRLFALKGRSTDKPFAVLVGDRDQALSLASPSDAAVRLMDRYWPGPLTVVTRRRGGLDIDLGGDPHTIGVRFPASSVIVELAGAVGPLVTTSANRSGEPSLTSLEEIAATFGADISVVFDGGVLSGDPSTVVDCTVTPVAVLRAGPIDAAVLRAVAEGRA